MNFRETVGVAVEAVEAAEADAEQERGAANWHQQHFDFS